MLSLRGIEDPVAPKRSAEVPLGCNLPLKVGIPTACKQASE